MAEVFVTYCQGFKVTSYMEAVLLTSCRLIFNDLCRYRWIKSTSYPFVKVSPHFYKFITRVISSSFLLAQSRCLSHTLGNCF